MLALEKLEATSLFLLSLAGLLKKSWRGEEIWPSLSFLLPSVPTVPCFCLEHSLSAHTTCYTASMLPGRHGRSPPFQPAWVALILGPCVLSRALLSGDVTGPGSLIGIANGLLTYWVNRRSVRATLAEGDSWSSFVKQTLLSSHEDTLPKWPEPPEVNAHPPGSGPLSLLTLLIDRSPV